MITANVKCPECDHTEPVEVQLHMGGDSSPQRAEDGCTLNVRAEVADEVKAEVAQRFEAHHREAHEVNT